MQCAMDNGCFLSDKEQHPVLFDDLVAEELIMHKVSLHAILCAPSCDLRQKRTMGSHNGVKHRQIIQALDDVREGWQISYTPADVQ